MDSPVAGLVSVFTEGKALCRHVRYLLPECRATNGRLCGKIEEIRNFKFGRWFSVEIV